MALQPIPFGSKPIGPIPFGSKPIAAPTPTAPTPSTLGSAGQTVIPGSNTGPAALGAQWGGQIKQAFQGGVQAVKEGVSQMAHPGAAAGNLPLGALKTVAGGINATLGAIAAPVMAPIGQIANNIGDKIGYTDAGRKIAESPAAPYIEKAAQGTQDASVVAGAIAGSVKAPALGAAIKDTAVGAVDKAASVPRSAATTLKSVMGKDSESIVANRVKELTKLEDSYSSVRKSTASSNKKGIDAKNILAQTDLLHEAVDNTGTIRTQNAIHELQEFIKPQEDVISANLEREGVSLPISRVKNALTTAIDKSGLEGDSLEAAYNKLDAFVKGLSRRVDDNGNIKLSKVQDAKTNKYATIDYTNEGAKIADKTIARTLKTIVEDNTKSVAVKDLNKELSSHFSVLSLLEKLDGKKVEGGRLGKYFAQAVGAGVGSHFGPLGAIVGAEIGGRLKGAAMSQKLSGKTGSGLSQSEAMKAAVAQGKTPPLMLPAPKPGAPNVSVNVPIQLRGAFADEKAVPKPDYSSNSLGNRNQAQTQNTTNAKSSNIPESVPQPAVKAIENHLTSAQQVFDNLPAEKDVSAILERTKTNIADGLAAQGYKDLATHIRTFVTTSYKTLSDFTKALWEHIKEMHKDESGFIRNPLGKKPTAKLGNAQTYTKEAASFVKKQPSRAALNALHDFLQHSDTRELPPGEETAAKFTSTIRRVIKEETGIDTYDWTDNKLVRFATAVEDHIRKLDTKHSLGGASKMPLLPIKPL